MATLIRYKATGHRRLVADFVARNLIARGVAVLANEPPRYETRAIVTPEPAEPAPADVVETKDDGLDEMDPTALRALADERGLKYHHRAGADRLRTLLRDGG